VDGRSPADRRSDRRESSGLDPHSSADRALGRRGVLAGGAGLAALLGGGWFFLLRDTEGPDDVAEEFVVTLDSGEFSAADELIHPDSPLDGAGQAADLLVAVAGFDAAIDALDISVLDSDVTGKGGGEATVDVATEIDLVVDQATVDVPLELRTADGDWYVWSVAA
jgi:hypothetical protein